MLKTSLLLTANVRMYYSNLLIKFKSNPVLISVDGQKKKYKRVEDCVRLGSECDVMALIISMGYWLFQALTLALALVCGFVLV